MIEMRRKQLSFGDGLIAEEVSDLREGWMQHGDAVLADEDIVMIVYDALGKRHPKSRSRGRRGVPAETVLRLLTLKHIRNWSYETLEREVRANLVYRDFTRVGAGKVPDAKTMGRWGVALGPESVKQIHERIVKIAAENGVTDGKRMRVDTTVVEANIHHPTDSTLLGDGVRVLIRTMKRITTIAGAVGTKLCDRSRSVKFRLLEIGRIARARPSSSTPIAVISGFLRGDGPNRINSFSVHSLPPVMELGATNWGRSRRSRLQLARTARDPEQAPWRAKPTLYRKRGFGCSEAALAAWGSRPPERANVVSVGFERPVDSLTW
jgi:hypothetical protein